MNILYSFVHKKNPVYNSFMLGCLNTHLYFNFLITVFRINYENNPSSNDLLK